MRNRTRARSTGNAEVATDAAPFGWLAWIVRCALPSLIPTIPECLTPRGNARPGYRVGSTLCRPPRPRKPPTTTVTSRKRSSNSSGPLFRKPSYSLSSPPPIYTGG